ncbi:MAG: hypothetical protein U0Z44_05390 [Kouleothrix sp.]
MASWRGQTPTKGVADLPPEVIQQVKDTLAKMQKGEFTRFDVFAGPIKDNTGKEIVPARAKLSRPTSTSSIRNRAAPTACTGGPRASPPSCRRRALA